MEAVASLSHLLENWRCPEEGEQSQVEGYLGLLSSFRQSLSTDPASALGSVLSFLRSRGWIPH